MDSVLGSLRAPLVCTYRVEYFRMLSDCTHAYGNNLQVLDFICMGSFSCCSLSHYRRSFSCKHWNQLFIFTFFHPSPFPSSSIRKRFSLNGLLVKPWSQRHSLLPTVQTFIVIAHRVHHSYFLAFRARRLASNFDNSRSRTYIRPCTL